jgi:hypothetical protein
MKRGRPAAVLVNCDVFEQKIAKPKTKAWRLEGSLKVAKGVDIDKSIREVRELHRRAWEERKERLAKDLFDD